MRNFASSVSVCMCYLLKRIMDILLLGSYTKFSCSFIKWYKQRAKITILPFHVLYPIAYPPTEWTNWPINDRGNSNLNWRQFSPCHNIHVYSTFIFMFFFFWLCYSWVKESLGLYFLFFSKLWTNFYFPREGGTLCCLLH